MTNQKLKVGSFAIFIFVRPHSIPLPGFHLVPVWTSVMVGVFGYVNCLHMCQLRVKVKASSKKRKHRENYELLTLPFMTPICCPEKLGRGQLFSPLRGTSVD